jgi:hypothetical protein
MTVEERLAKVEAILGDWDTPPVLASGGTPVSLPNGRYDLKESDYQLHSAIDQLKKDWPAGKSILEVIEARLSGPVDSIAPKTPE